MGRKINKFYILFNTLLFAVLFSSFSGKPLNGNPGGPDPEVLILKTDVSCFGGNDGTATAQGVGGTPGYTYFWSNGNSGATISNLTIGTYTVTVTDAIALTGTSTIIIGQPSQLSLSLINQTNVDCFGNSTGSVSVNGSGGTMGYSYAWSNGVSGATNSNLLAGTYTATITDGNLCTSTEVFIITQPTIISLLASSTNITCNGDNNGNASASGSGGEGSLSYAWSNGMSGETISNLAPGNYTVTATDANNCTQTESTSVTQPNAINLTTMSTNVICNGDNNGTASVSGSGGGGGFSYAWSNGMSGETIANLGGGTYTVTATDATNCSEVQTVDVMEPNVIIVNILSTNISCNGANDASAIAMGNGGTGGFTYIWSNGMSGQTISNLSAGTYIATATDANNCTQTQIVSFTEPSAISVTIFPINITCNGASNGSASAVGNGGAAGFTYTWSNGMNGQMISNLSAGTYTATATDANNCTQTESVNISEPSPVVVNISQNNILCNGENNGSANAIGNGGTGNITYNWSNGMNGANITDLAVGTYTVTATDVNSCTQTESVTISEPSPIVVNISQNNILCNGGNNGSATVNGNGGTGNLSYSWSNGMSGETISNLDPGTYTVTTTDANNCTLIESVTITEPNLIVVSISQTNVLCNGEDSGSATADGNGGTGNLTYSWSNGMSGETIANLAPGTYTVTTTDGNNCTLIESVTIFESSLITLNVFSNEISCNNENDGSVTASGNGGAGFFSYSWSNGMSGATISNLAANTYTVSATDANNCVQTETVTITNPNAISLSISQNNIDCFGNNNGSAIASGNGGTGNLTYIWSNGISGTTISNLTAGTYTVSATDANNCIKTETVTITEPNAINISTVQTDVNCFGNSNGSASANGSGGTGNLTYAWSNGMSGENISNLTAGTYILTVTDANNCTATESVTINQPSNLIVNASATGETGAGANDGTATAAPSGGNSGYTFSWSTGSSNQTITNLTPGSYTVTITDNNMCTAEETVIVSSFNCAISINVATTDALCFGETGSATASAQNGVDPITYLWSNGETNATISNLTPEVTYSVTVTDANNCPASMSISISQPAQLQIAASTTDVSCNGLSDGSVIINVTGGTPPYSSTLPNLDGNNLSADIYTASVLDANNCPIEINFEISEPPVISPNATATAVTANGVNDGSAASNPSGGVGNFTFLWSNGMTTSMINNLAPGSYTVTVTDGNNCSSNQTVTVNDIGCAISISTTSTNLLCFGDSNGMASVSVNTGAAPFSYLWSNGAITEIISNLVVGSYTVTVTDNNNCPVSETVTITQPDLLELSENVQSVLQLDCFGNNNGVAAIEVTGGASGNIFNWSNGMMGNPISNLPAGTFTGTVTDANGCFETINFTITQPDELLSNATATNETAANANDGTATASPTGGTGTFNYLWSNGAMSASISNLVPGTYTVTTTDANNCESIESVEVNAFGCNLTATVSTTNATCSNAADGSAIASPSGGQNYTYSWSSGGTLPTEINLLPGTYTVTINDATNCTFIETITIAAVDNILPTAVAQNISVSLDENGNATITPSMIDNGSFDNCGGVTLDIDITSFDCNDLGENTVTLTVSDLAGNLDTTIAIVTVNDLLPPTISCPTNIVIDECTGLVTYGDPTLFDNCSAPFFIFTGPASGTIFPSGETVITMIAFDQSDNSTECTFTVTIDHVLELSATSTDSPCADDNLGSAAATATGTSATFDYIWSNTEITPNIMNLAPDTYTVTVTDNSGCTSTSEVIVTEPNPLEIILDNVTDESDLGANDGAITVTVNGGFGLLNYEWTLNGNVISTDEDPTNLVGGIYILNVSDANGCNLTSSEITVGTMVDLSLIHI